MSRLYSDPLSQDSRGETFAKAQLSTTGRGHHWMADRYVLELSTMEVVTAGWLTVTC